METLSQLLPIFIYILLIIVIVVAIVLGIKLILVVDKATKLMDDVNEKVQKVSPLIDTIGVVSNKFNDIMTTVVKSVENLVLKLFFKNRNKQEMESEEDE